MAAKYYRVDIVETARKRFCTCGAWDSEQHQRLKKCRCPADKLGLMETSGVVRLRTFTGNWRFEVGQDGVRTAYEQDVRTFGPLFRALAEVAQFLGVEKR